MISIKKVTTLCLVAMALGSGGVHASEEKGAAMFCRDARLSDANHHSYHYPVWDTTVAKILTVNGTPKGEEKNNHIYLFGKVEKTRGRGHPNLAIEIPDATNESARQYCSDLRKICAKNGSDTTPYYIGAGSSNNFWNGISIKLSENDYYACANWRGDINTGQTFDSGKAREDKYYDVTCSGGKKGTWENFRFECAQDPKGGSELECIVYADGPAGLRGGFPMPGPFFQITRPDTIETKRKEQVSRLLTYHKDLLKEHIGGPYCPGSGEKDPVDIIQIPTSIQAK